MSTNANKVTNLIKNKQFSYSFEVTPTISLDDIGNLRAEPTFYSITWHAKSHECKSLDIAPLQLASSLKRKGKEVLLHLSCDLLKKDFLNKLLRMLQYKGICNLFVILGESYDGSNSDFKSSKELIKYIRQENGNYFCIGVAGLPADQSDEKLLLLKEKVDSGADFIITQAIFEPNIYKNYVNKCENFDIVVPIIPGIFLYDTFDELVAFTNLCKVKVSEDLLNYVKRKDLSTPGTDIVRILVKDISDFGFRSVNFHFFTLNKLGRVDNFLNDYQV